jgi:Protein of unknown function (DUF3300)
MAGAISRRPRKLAQSLLSFALSAALIAGPAMAQAQDNPAAPAAPAAGAAAPATGAEANPAEPAAEESFTRAELEKLLAPIALYPDPLLAQMLPASAYPVQIVQAQRWLDKNKALVAKNDYSGIDNQNWDPAVKALARFPDVIKTMSADLDWTTDLGDAEVNQPQDVAEVIQDLRAKAEAAGTLKTTDQQTVERVGSSTPPESAAVQGSPAPETEASYISIQPTDPSTVYVPTYDAAAVYQPYTGIAPLLGFGAGIAVGALWNNNYWNWEPARSIRRPGPAIRAGVATSITATSTSGTKSTSATTRGRGGRTATIGPAWAASRGSAPTGRAAPGGQVGQAASAVRAGQVGLAGWAGQAGLAGSAGQVGLAGSAGQVGLAASGVPAGPGELAVWAGQVALAGELAA